MKRNAFLFLIVLMIASCDHFFSPSSGGADSTAIVQKASNEGQRFVDEQEVDSAVATLLVAGDYVAGCRDTDALYHYYQTLARAYERKNMFELQSSNLRKQLTVAIAQGNKDRMADTYFALGVSHYAMEKHGEARDYLRQAIELADADSARFLSRCHLMRCQIFLQMEMMDSVAAALDQAKEAYPAIIDEELYILSEVYMAYNMGDEKGAEEMILKNKDRGGLYTHIELLRLLQDIHEEQGKTAQALADAKQLAVLNDSAAQLEASESLTKIHSLKHEEQMLVAKAERQALQSQAHVRMLVFFLILALVLLVCALVMGILRKKAIIARQGELEALKLAEDAQSSEAEMRALNEDLQRKYYEHLYAILLPILNAERSQSGHIDLNEKSWKLIEENTDMVLPHFTRTLRKNHDTINDEDVRFCCLVAMKVPNPVIANIYGISPSSVAVRKQRMKKKLDECVSKETLENYLSRYCL